MTKIHPGLLSRSNPDTMRRWKLQCAELSKYQADRKRPGDIRARKSCSGLPAMNRRTRKKAMTDAAPSAVLLLNRHIPDDTGSVLSDILRCGGRIRTGSFPAGASLPQVRRIRKRLSLSVPYSMSFCSSAVRRILRSMPVYGKCICCRAPMYHC